MHLNARHIEGQLIIQFDSNLVNDVRSHGPIFIYPRQVTPTLSPVRLDSIFSRFSKKKEKEEPPVSPASEERRKYIPGEDGSLLKEQMHRLSANTSVWKLADHV